MFVHQAIRDANINFESALDAAMAKLEAKKASEVISSAWDMLETSQGSKVILLNSTALERCGVNK